MAGRESRRAGGVEGQSDFGPSQGELWFRLVAGLAGTAAVIAAVALKGVSGIAAVEVVGIAGAFFAGSAVWSARRLRRGR